MVCDGVSECARVEVPARLARVDGAGRGLLSSGFPSVLQAQTEAGRLTVIREVVDRHRAMVLLESRWWRRGPGRTGSSAQGARVEGASQQRGCLRVLGGGDALTSPQVSALLAGVWADHGAVRAWVCVSRAVLALAAFLLLSDVLTLLPPASPARPGLNQ